MSDELKCNLCHKPMRECGFWDNKYWFACDDETCPTDVFKIEVITKPAKQKDGSYLGVLR